jgi:hypothetical protein
MFPLFGWNENNFPLQLKINQKLLKIARQHKISPSTVIKNNNNNTKTHKQRGDYDKEQKFFFRGS